jgi:DNA (cytosine-5)-methyltransferase 1
MKHLGDISKVDGVTIEPVDIITFGSPCQDLSVAGKQAGLKHTDNGDEETTRSGLFMEAVRIIKEMRQATNGKHPTFALWENVPGAFSSNRGGDFRVVLEELIKIAEPTAVMPEVPSKGWPYADSYLGDGWSLAYRVLDAQYWGVPQRRRRIYLVLDLRGERARDVLFEREGLRWYFTQGRTPWQGAPADAQGSLDADDVERGRRGLDAVGFDSYNLCEPGDKGRTVTTPSGGLNKHIPCVVAREGVFHEAYQHHGWRESEKAGTLTAAQNDHVRGDTPLVCEPIYCLQGNGIDRADTAGCNGKGVKENICYTLNTIDRPAVSYLASGKNATGTLLANAGTKLWLGNQEAFSGDYHIIEEQPAAGVDCRNGAEILEAVGALQASADHTLNCNNVVRTQYIVRRLTPTEFARLQGFPDKWGHIQQKNKLTEEERVFWQDVRNTHAALNGRAVKDYTEKQMLAWYNKLHTDSAEYKMWGNGIALPTALYCMQGLAEALERTDKKCD